MTNLFIKYDIETETVIAGPQGSQPDGSWIPFIPATDLKPRQKSSTHWVEEMGVVMQVPGDEHVPDYAEQRRLAYPKLAEQLDKLFHDIDNDRLDKTGQFYTSLKVVKDSHPKPDA